MLAFTNSRPGRLGKVTLRQAFQPGLFLDLAVSLQQDLHNRTHSANYIALDMLNGTYLCDKGAKTNVLSRPIIKKMPHVWQLKPGSPCILLWGSKMWVYIGSTTQIGKSVDMKETACLSLHETCHSPSSPQTVPRQAVPCAQEQA